VNSHFQLLVWKCLPYLLGPWIVLTKFSFWYLGNISNAPSHSSWKLVLHMMSFILCWNSNVQYSNITQVLSDVLSLTGSALWTADIILSCAKSLHLIHNSRSPFP
jgi:hypothetical protein